MMVKMIIMTKILNRRHTKSLYFALYRSIWIEVYLMFVIFDWRTKRYAHHMRTFSLSTSIISRARKNWKDYYCIRKRRLSTNQTGLNGWHQVKMSSYRQWMCNHCECAVVTHTAPVSHRGEWWEVIWVPGCIYSYHMHKCPIEQNAATIFYV